MASFVKKMQKTCYRQLVDVHKISRSKCKNNRKKIRMSFHLDQSTKIYLEDI